MSDKASIILKFDIVAAPQYTGDTPTHCEGVMVNLYRGLDPFGLVTRSAYGLDFFIAHSSLCRFWKNYSEYGYETLRRMFDVDFIHRYMHVSRDMFMWHSNQIASGKLSLDKINDGFLFYDVDYGDLYIDITGEAPDNIQVKYGFYHSHSLLDARSYSEKYKEQIGSEYPLLEDSFMMFDEMAEFMTEGDLENFRNTDFSKYFIDFVPKPEDIKTITDKMEWPIEDLGLGLRSYNCLKRADIQTVGDLTKKTKTDLMAIRSLSEVCITEICDMLSELGITLED